MDLPPLGRRSDEIEKAPNRERRESEQHQAVRESQLEGAVAHVTEEPVEQLGVGWARRSPGATASTPAAAMPVCTEISCREPSTSDPSTQRRIISGRWR